MATSQFCDAGTKSFPNSANLAQYLRVRLNAGVLAACGTGDTDCLGVMANEVFSTDTTGPVVLSTKQGTILCVASEAITAGAACYAAASGKVASTGTVLVGEVLTAATANNDVIEVLPSPAAIIGAVARTSLTQDNLKPYPVILSQFRVHDAQQTNLPGTAGTDDLAIIGGTLGTAPPTLRGVDFGGTTTTAYARTQLVLPAEYVDGETVTVRIHAGMLTTVADTSATVDLVAYLQDGEGAVGSDICATAAQSINSLTLADKDFTITPTSLVAGSVLDIRIAIAGSDTGDLGVMIPVITDVVLLCDVKG